MRFVFVIGVEGAGHGMIRSVVHRFLQQPHVEDEGLWHGGLIQLWDPDCTKALDLLPLTKHALTLPGKQIMFESASFPYGEPRNPLRRPDIIGLVEILHECAIEPRFLVLYRNPLSCVNSAVRRGFTNNVNLQARIIEDNYTYITSQLTSLPRSVYKVLHFEAFLTDPTDYIRSLADWLGTTEALIDIDRLISPTDIDAIPGAVLEQCSHIIGQQKMEYWFKRIMRGERI